MSQPPYLRMVLPKWALAKRAQQRRPVGSGLPRDCIASPEPRPFRDQDEDQATVLDWAAMRLFLRDDRSPPPCSLDDRVLIPRATNFIDVAFAPDQPAHRVVIDWTAYPPPYQQAPVFHWSNSSNNTTSTSTSSFATW